MPRTGLLITYKWSIFLYVPGKENKCPGLNYDINDHLPMLIDEEREVDVEPVCEATEVMPPMNTTRVNSMMVQSPDGSCSNSDRETAEVNVKVDTNNDRKRMIMGNAYFDDNAWSKTTEFNQQWIAKINQHQKDVSFRNRIPICTSFLTTLLLFLDSPSCRNQPT